MAQPFDVVTYDIDDLKRLLSDLSGAPRAAVESKLHLQYFDEYFSHLGAKTIVVEKEYVDRDFLEDFAAYYVRCFHEYRRFCARLHFFSSSFDASTFKTMLQERVGEARRTALQENYLGFVVVKPLPQTLIGRTCLVTYPSENRRQFPTVRQYSANLFGIPLTVESLAFQEQDTVVAACATSALWSVFHGTAECFGHAIPSPVEITKAATAPANIDTRILPNPGLSSVEMAQAIRALPLEPFLVNATDPWILRTTVYAYLRARIPVMLALELYGCSEGKEPALKGHHAVAVTGFNLCADVPAQHEPTEMLHRAVRIDRLYVHDDQVGPFARMELLPSEETVCLKSSWGHRWPEYESVNAAPKLILVPLYHKIRIPYHTIENALLPFDALLDLLRQMMPWQSRLEWDVFLTTNNEFKCDLASGDLPIDVDCRERLRVKSLPRFLWRATAWDGDQRILDLLFDATDIEQGNFVVEAISYDDTLVAVLEGLADDETIEKEFGGTSAWLIIQSFQGD